LKGRLKEVHLLVGVTTLLVFPGTRGYMRMNIPELYGGEETIRYLFRSRHISILFSSLINILLGIYLRRSIDPGNARMQFTGSVLLLPAPAVHIAAFVVEPFSEVRFLTTVAAFAVFCRDHSSRDRRLPIGP
jgi:hypothetical protein